MKSPLCHHPQELLLQMKSMAHLFLKMFQQDLETISDLEANKEFTFSITPIRRRGGQFDDLSKNQIYQLEYFIMHHTIGIV